MPDLLMKVEVKEESWNDLEAVERLETAEERRKGRKNGGLGGEIRTGRGRGRRRKPRSSILSTSCLPVALSLTPQGHPNLLQNRILLYFTSLLLFTGCPCPIHYCTKKYQSSSKNKLPIPTASKQPHTQAKARRLARR